ncbi:MAG TPA: hypothetical protein VFS16_02985 [Acidimicrobiia bacterium]|nr:hypothetical protein [Acidimicrobiia bacterium]
MKRHPVSAVLVAAGLAAAALTFPLVTPASPAAAATVCSRWAANGGSDAADGSATRPYRSLGKLAASLAAGQTGCLPAGAVYEAVEGNGIVKASGGRAGVPVTITSAPGGGRAKVRGWVHVAPEAHDVTLTGLDFIGTATHADGNPTAPKSTHINLQGDRVSLTASDITNPFGICVNAGRLDAYQQADPGDPADDVVIDGNRVHGCGMSDRLVWTQGDSGAHGIYLVYTRNARVAENLVYGNRWRGFQAWPRAEGTLVAGNVFDGNATHVNLGSVLADGFPWHTRGTVVRDNIMTGRTGFRPDTNQAAVIGNFPAGSPSYGNLVTGNCIDPAGGISAGNGMEVTGNVTAVAAYQDRAAGDYRLTATSLCRGKGPRSIQPAGSTGGTTGSTGGTTGSTGGGTGSAGGGTGSAGGGTGSSGGGTGSAGGGTAVRVAGVCSGGRVAVTAPSAMTSSTGAAEWVFWRPFLFRWDGARWAPAGDAGWFYGSAGTAGLRLLTGGAPWAQHATGTPLGAGAAVAFTGLTPGFYAVVDVLHWNTSGRTEQPVRPMPGALSYCRA